MSTPHFPLVMSSSPFYLSCLVWWSQIPNNPRVAQGGPAGLGMCAVRIPAPCPAASGRLPPIAPVASTLCGAAPGVATHGAPVAWTTLGLLGTRCSSSSPPPMLLMVEPGGAVLVHVLALPPLPLSLPHLSLFPTGPPPWSLVALPSATTGHLSLDPPPLPGSVLRVRAAGVVLMTWAIAVGHLLKPLSSVVS